jgi:hypothetical protein
MPEVFIVKQSESFKEHFILQVADRERANVALRMAICGENDLDALQQVRELDEFFAQGSQELVLSIDTHARVYTNRDQVQYTWIYLTDRQFEAISMHLSVRIGALLELLLMSHAQASALLHMATSGGDPDET